MYVFHKFQTSSTTYKQIVVTNYEERSFNFKFNCCCSPLQLTERKSFSQFPSTAVVKMNPRWDPLVSAWKPRGLTSLFRRRFSQWLSSPIGVSSGGMKKIDCCNLLVFRGRFHLVRRYHQTFDSSETLPNIYRQRWLATQRSFCIIDLGLSGI